VRQLVRARTRDDRGASLILTLAFVLGVGLVTGAATYAVQGGIDSIGGTLGHAQNVADVDGALQAALNDVRSGTYDFDAGSTACFSQGGTAGGVRYYDESAPGSAWSDSPSASAHYAVACTPGPGTGGDSTGVAQNSNTKPGSAILTLGTDPGEPGIGLGSNATLLVKGKVVSNSAITQGGSSSTLTSPWAQAKARGACSTSYVISTPAALCSYTPTAADAAAFTDPAVSKPGYALAAPAASALILRTVPTSCAPATVTLQPGYYDDASALTTLSACGNTIVFAPGTYWFDFRNSEAASATYPAVPSGSNVWTVNNKSTYVIGGTLDGWSGGVPPKFPGACVSPLTDATAKGVRFVFGGDSRLVVAAGNVELCGTYSSSAPAIPLSGATAGADPGTSTSGAVAAATGTATGFSPASGAPLVTALAAKGGTAATATISRATGGTATATLSSFALPSAVPAGAVLTGAQVLVTHREQNSGSGDGVALQVTPARTGASSITPAVNLRPASTDDTVDLMSQAFVDEVHRYGLTDLAVRWSVTGKKGGSQDLAATLDRVQVNLTWKPPAVRAESVPVAGSNCVGTAPYVPAATNCALVTTSGSKTSVYFQGTVYAPLAALDVELTNASAQVFRSGLIVRSLRIKVTPSSGYTGPVIEVPDDSPGVVPLDVYLTAYYCPGGSSACTSPPSTANGWVLAGRAAATFDDTSGARRVTVKAWQMLR
jgi:hypothetical protein